ncbi:DUF6233 domain-containing protein [Streptomyces sp. NBC_01571]|uniref:DUF6233 domain-containing protein n=1 Tax=Streptomyces sp. NBC_01571 TaxID=2975883 RepID=UPI002251C840|nr:DUF6233 domain-containing protein [Streptomyces sp. NBC_01571]MCX4575639.1 DUF6233 domain-containing protein [Streptomyces sp. NBC_01571]
MSDLPPDPQRLRAILAHLDQQLASQATVATYLQLQRDAVRRALAAAERPTRAPVRHGRQERRAQRTAEPPASKLRPGTYMLEPKLGPQHPRAPYIHVGGCPMTQRDPSPCTPEEARLALTQSTVGAEPCDFCRPDTALGIDVA